MNRFRYADGSPRDPRAWIGYARGTGRDRHLYAWAQENSAGDCACNLYAFVHPAGPRWHNGMAYMAALDRADAAMEVGLPFLGGGVGTGAAEIRNAIADYMEVRPSPSRPAGMVGYIANNIVRRRLRDLAPMSRSTAFRRRAILRSLMTGRPTLRYARRPRRVGLAEAVGRQRLRPRFRPGAVARAAAAEAMAEDAMEPYQADDLTLTGSALGYGGRDPAPTGRNVRPRLGE